MRKERAYGPYENRNGWRIVIVRADGARVAKTFSDHATAAKTVEEIRRQVDARTLGDAVTDYLDTLRGNGVRASTLTTTRHRLMALLQLKAGDRALRSVTARVANRLYRARVTDGVSASTHRGELGCAVRLFDHCAERGWTSVNPFADVKPVGRLAAGKPQLRVDEARRLLGALDETPEGTAVMMCLLMGLRAHEVVQRVGRDVDNGGRLLWIPHSKTAAGVRQVAIPAALRQRLMGLVRGPDDRLFSLTRYALHYHVIRFCRLAGVPRVTPHGLRGTFATLAVTGGGMSGAPAAVAALAPQFGHNDNGATMRRHYLAPGAEETANVARLEFVLQPEEIGAN